MTDQPWTILLHLAALVLCAAMLLGSVRSMRLGVAVAAALAIVAAVQTTGLSAFSIWAAVLLAACLLPLAFKFSAERNSSFSEEEDSLRAAMMAGLSGSEARGLIGQGHWVNGRAGEELTRENEAVSHLFYLHTGAATVEHGGMQVGAIGAGDLIGDATALSGAPASGTVLLAEPSRFWCISAPALRAYLTLHPNVRPALERQINQALETKLRRANAALSGAS